jgi:hypothetical protein
MPMPVSLTLSRTIPSVVRAVMRTSPRVVNFNALEMKLRRICASLRSSV